MREQRGDEVGRCLLCSAPLRPGEAACPSCAVRTGPEPTSPSSPGNALRNSTPLTAPAKRRRSVRGGSRWFWLVVAFAGFWAWGFSYGLSGVLLDPDPHPSFSLTIWAAVVLLPALWFAFIVALCAYVVEFVYRWIRPRRQLPDAAAALTTVAVAPPTQSDSGSQGCNLSDAIQEPDRLTDGRSG
jgi:hypothetical protein